MSFKRKSIRLSHENYLGQRWYFLTICCDRRRREFGKPARATWLLDRLRETAAGFSMGVHAYCIMPDHLHLLVEGLEPTSNLLAFVSRFKQRTAHEWQKRFGRPLWQGWYYDHVVRWKDSPTRSRGMYG